MNRRRKYGSRRVTLLLCLTALSSTLIACTPQAQKKSTTREIPSSIQLPGVSNSPGQAGPSAPAPGTADSGATRSPKRARPVVPGQPSRVFVMAGFAEDCSPQPTKLRVVTAPLKGDVTFREGQGTTIRRSKSGNCIGEKIVGTGIYYTAKASTTGSDSFTVEVVVGSDAPVLRSFDVEIGGS